VSAAPTVSVERTTYSDGTSRVDLVVSRPAMQAGGAGLAVTGDEDAATSVVLRPGDNAVRARVLFTLSSDGHMLQLTYELEVGATGTPVAKLSAVSGQCG
jgi:hypothetical protein